MKIYSLFSGLMVFLWLFAIFSGPCDRVYRLLYSYPSCGTRSKKILKSLVNCWLCGQ